MGFHLLASFSKKKQLFFHLVSATIFCWKLPLFSCERRPIENFNTEAMLNWYMDRNRRLTGLRKTKTSALIIALLTYCLCIGTGCEKRFMQDGLERIKTRGELVMITRNNSTCYYEGPTGPTGFEYELANGFADYLGLKLKVIAIEDEVEMIKALLLEKGDILAPGTSFGQTASRFVALGPSYYQTQQQVVGRRDGIALKELKDLVGSTIWVTPGSARMETLKTLKQFYPDLSWMVISDYSNEELLRMVWNRSLPLTVVESNTMALNHRFYPELVVHWNLGESQKLRWAVHPHNRRLRKVLEDWFLLPKTQASLSGLVEHYYSHLEDFDYVDIVRFHNRINYRLPKYRKYFETAGKQFGLDWRLIAAQSYQESHWNPRAKSPTGVRGMMMLTLQTSRLMGLKNRLNAKASISAGARFLSSLHQNIGNTVAEPDRTFMALAAYNLGYGHLQDVRSLAKELGQSPDTWRSIRSVLPLLQQKSYYQKLTHGFARGEEAVTYVDRIRTYHKILLSEVKVVSDNLSASNQSKNTP